MCVYIYIYISLCPNVGTASGTPSAPTGALLPGSTVVLV